MDAVPGGTGVFYQAMPAVGADGKNIMKLIPVKVVDGQFIQTQISKHKVGPTPHNPVSMNIASTPVQVVKKAALNPSATQQVVRNQVFHVNTVPNHGDLNPQNSLNKDSLQRHTVKFIDKVPQIGTPATNYEKLERLSCQLPVTVKSPALPRGQYLQIPPHAQVRTVPASELPPGIKKQIFTSSANSSPGSGLPSVVYVSPITTINQGVTPLRDSALPSPKLLPKTLNETLCGPQSKASKPRLKLIPRFSQRPNSPIKWTVEEEESSTSPTCDPLHSSTVTSEILRTVAERENANKHSNIIMKPVSPLTEDKSGQGRENALVMCNGKVFFVSKKHSISPKIGKNDPPTSAIKSDELKKNMVPSSQPLFKSAAPEIRQDLKIIIPDESDDVIDLCDDDAQDGSTQKPASINMSAVSHVDEDNVIFVSYIPPKSVSGSTQHLKLKAQMALVMGTDQTGDCLSNSVTEQRNLDGARGSNGRDEVVAHRGKKPGMAASPVKDPKYFCGSGMMNMHDNEDLNINCQQSTSTQQLESMEVDVATGSPADPADEVCSRTKEDTHKMESSINPTTSWTSSQEPKSHQMDDHSLRQIFGITADVKICLQRIEEPVMSGEHSQKPTSRLSDGELFLQYLYTPDVTDRDSGLLSVKHEIELADQEKSVDAAIPSHHTHSRPLRCSNFKLKTKPFPALMCNSGQSLLKETSCDVYNEQVVDYVTPIDKDFLSTDENEILNSQNTDATLQTPSFLDLNANPRRICRTRKRTICPCCMPGTQDPAFKSSTKAVEPEKWAWTTEQTSKKSGRTKVVRKSVKPSGRINFLTAKNRLNYEVPSSGSLCSTSMNSNELKQQKEIKRLKELLREKEAALELMRNSIS